MTFSQNPNLKIPLMRNGPRKLSSFSEEKKAKIIKLYLSGEWSIGALETLHGHAARRLLEPLEKVKHNKFGRYGRDGLKPD